MGCFFAATKKSETVVFFVIDFFIFISKETDRHYGPNVNSFMMP